MAHVQMKNAALDRKDARATVHCGGCGGMREHALGCPFNGPCGWKLENNIMAQYYKMGGTTPSTWNRTLLGMPTRDRGMTISNATGHVRIRPVSSLRCIRDNDKGRPAYMCMQMDSAGNMQAWDSAFDTLVPQ